MLNQVDQEKLFKASQSANLFVQDLRVLTQAENPLLGDIAIEMLKQAISVEQQLKRLVGYTKF